MGTSFLWAGKEGGRGGGRADEKEIRDSVSSANQKATISKRHSEVCIQLEGTERSGWDLSANFWNKLCELLRPLSAQIKDKATKKVNNTQLGSDKKLFSS